MINRVVLIGRLTEDPQLNHTQSGVPVANFTLAVDRSFKNQHGERETDFIDVVVWQKLAEVCSDYLVKGQKAGVDGRIRKRSYVAQSGENQGQRRYVTEVVAENVDFLEKPRNAEPTEEFDVDDIPF